METILRDFLSITNYPIVVFLTKYVEFSQNNYNDIYNYFSGEKEDVSQESMSNLNWLLDECSKIISVFKSFENKLNNCGYWELMELIDNINTELEKLKKTPKYARTVKTKTSYKRTVQYNSQIGGGVTVEDVANDLTMQESTEWQRILQENDIKEFQWEIDKIRGVNAFTSGSFTPASTIIDQPIGDRVYGSDIRQTIDFKNGDLILVTGKLNLEQKIGILLNLKRGDVPEFPLFGKNPFFNGSSSKEFSIIGMVNDIKKTFLQNDLFDDVSVSGLGSSESEFDTLTLSIKTIYSNETFKEIRI
nr:MAG TPA: hypothetical protein [Caudoviricetes sp.]